MTLKLTANLRQALGKQAANLRQAGKIPAVLYGHKIDNLNLELNYIEFEKTMELAGESTILDVVVDGREPLKALISEVQYAPVSGRISHVDLHQINMKEKINANVEIKFVGESRIVKEDGGLVIHNFSELEIRCMPTDLIHEIIVDVSVLKNFDDIITVADLKLPAALEIIGHEPEDVIAIAVKPKAEVEEAPVVAAVEGDAAAGAPVAGAEGAKPEGDKVAEKK
ncbi:MAG: 50S ribosomal protein L25 [Patescibacteria group bacterium]